MCGNENSVPTMLHNCSDGSIRHNTERALWNINELQVPGRLDYVLTLKHLIHFLLWSQKETVCERSELSHFLGAFLLLLEKTLMDCIKTLDSSVSGNDQRISFSLTAEEDGEESYCTIMHLNNKSRQTINHFVKWMHDTFFYLRLFLFHIFTTYNYSKQAILL